MKRSGHQWYSGHDVGLARSRPGFEPSAWRRHARIVLVRDMFCVGQKSFLARIYSAVNAYLAVPLWKLTSSTLASCLRRA